MPSFPTLSRGSTALIPYADAREFATTAIRFVNDTEQRWNDRGALRRFQLTVDGTGEDVSRVRNFWNSVVGPRDTWDITINGETISNLVFDGDDFPAVVSTGNGASVELSVWQVRT